MAIQKSKFKRSKTIPSKLRRQHRNSFKQLFRFFRDVDEKFVALKNELAKQQVTKQQNESSSVALVTLNSLVTEQQRVIKAKEEEIKVKDERYEIFVKTTLQSLNQKIIKNEEKPVIDQEADNKERQYNLILLENNLIVSDNNNLKKRIQELRQRSR